MDNNLQQVTKLPTDKNWILIGCWTLLFTFGGLMLWAALAPLQSAVSAPGRVSVASLNKTIQHLDGGLVSSIAVRDGDVVEQGELLISLHHEPLQIELDEVVIQQLEVEAGLERLTAESEAAEELVFSDLLNSQAEHDQSQYLLANQKTLFDYRRQVLSKELEVMAQRVEQAQQQSEGVTSLLVTLQQRLRLVNDDLKAMQQLSHKKMVSSTQIRQLLSKKAEIEGEIAEQRAEKARLREQIGENKQQSLLKKLQHQEEIALSRRELQQKKIALVAQRQRIEDRLSRVEIRAPVSGKIKGLEIVTEGAVLASGRTLMEIVPEEQSFRIDARVSPLDIDALYPGLKAEVRFPVFEGALQLPPLWAELADVSTDTYTPAADEEPYYKARLTLSVESVALLEQSGWQLVSGMPAELFIKTGERTLIDYLIKPFRVMLAKSMNEA